jgi:hypothetical protein
VETFGGARRHRGQQSARHRLQRFDGLADQGRHIVRQVPRQAGDGVPNVFPNQGRGNGDCNRQVAQALEQAQALGLIPRDFPVADLPAEQFQALAVGEQREG